MSRRIGIGGELLATLAAAALTGIACCGPLLIQWVGFLFWAVGGRVLLLGLVRYEVPVLLVIAAAALLGRRLATERITRWANTLLGGVALFLAVLRLTWEVRRGVVMAFEPVYQLFIYRQTLLLALAGLVFAIRLGLLVARLRRRACSGPACPLPEPQHGGSTPSWT